MVEEARLESVYTGNRIEGSNPSVSATLKNTTTEKNTVLLNVNGLRHQSIFFLHHLLQYSKLHFRFVSQFEKSNITSEKFQISLNPYC